MASTCPSSSELDVGLEGVERVQEVAWLHLALALYLRLCAYVSAAPVQYKERTVHTKNG